MTQIQQIKDASGLLKSIREKKRRLCKRIALLGRKLRYDDESKEANINEYLEVNDQLKAVRIYEAELCHTVNRLK